MTNIVAAMIHQITLKSIYFKSVLNGNMNYALVGQPKDGRKFSPEDILIAKEDNSPACVVGQITSIRSDEIKLGLMAGFSILGVKWLTTEEVQALPSPTLLRVQELVKLNRTSV